MPDNVITSFTATMDAAAQRNDGLLPDSIVALERPLTALITLDPADNQQFIARIWDGSTGARLLETRGRRGDELTAWVTSFALQSASRPSWHLVIDIDAGRRAMDKPPFGNPGGGGGTVSPTGDPNPKGIYFAPSATGALPLGLPLNQPYVFTISEQNIYGPPLTNVRVHVQALEPDPQSDAQGMGTGLAQVDPPHIAVATLAIAGTATAQFEINTSDGAPGGFVPAAQAQPAGRLWIRPVGGTLSIGESLVVPLAVTPNRAGSSFFIRYEVLSSEYHVDAGSAAGPDPKDFNWAQGSIPLIGI